MSTTKIEWADVTLNPIVGCAKVSPACDHCYAERMAYRLAMMGKRQYREVVYGVADDKPGVDVDSLRFTPHWNGRTAWVDGVIEQALRMRKPTRIFWGSMTDLFHQATQLQWIDRIMAVVACTPRHTHIFLTKRPERMFAYMKGLSTGYCRASLAFDCLGDICPASERVEAMRRFRGINAKDAPPTVPTGPLQNLWLGVTAENQEQADKRITVLLSIPAAKRFVSIEPMLGPVDLRHLPQPSGDVIDGFRGWTEFAINGGARVRGLDWVICGGENGPGARPMHPEWAHSLCVQCRAAGVPFFFKGWGEWAAHPVHRASAERMTHFVCEEGHFDLLNPDRVTKHRDADCCMAATIGIRRVGKQAAGRFLDGREWNELPEARA